VQDLELACKHQREIDYAIDNLSFSVGLTELGVGSA